MRSIRSWTGVLAAGAAVSVVAAAPAAAHFHGDRGYALDTGGNVHSFALGSPGAATAKKITGLGAGESIVGIDERPKTGALYAVTKGPDGAARAYTVDPATGAATAAFALVRLGTADPVVLTGAKFGVDFNPAADALRIVGDDGQNLRALPSDRLAAGVQRFAGDTFTDGTLSYSPLGTVPRPAATGIFSSAYTNNLATTATTSLFNIDSSQSDLTLQSPPNDGTQVKVADLPINGATVQGFDVLSRAGSPAQNIAFVASATGRVALPPRNPVEQLLQLLGLQQPRSQVRTQLSTLDLTTGALTAVGTFATQSVVDIAVDTPAP